MPEEFDFEKLSEEMFPGPLTQKQTLILVFAINNLATAVTHHNDAVGALQQASNAIHERLNAHQDAMVSSLQSLMGAIDVVSNHVVDLEKRITKLEYLS